MIRLSDNHVVVVDIETTDVAISDVRGEWPRIVEVGACLINREFEIEGEWSSLVRPQRMEDFTDFSESFTGISSNQLDAALPWSEVWEKFAKFTRFNGYKLVSWGSVFDYSVLRAEYWRYELPYPHAYPFIDALSIGYVQAGEWGFKTGGWSLGGFCERFGIEPEERHRALPGARRVVGVLRAISELGE